MKENTTYYRQLAVMYRGEGQYQAAEAIGAMANEVDALAAELARVRKEAADDRRAGATKLMQADAEIDALRAQVARLEGFTESAQYSRDAEFALLDMLGDMD